MQGGEQPAQGSTGEGVRKGYPQAEFGFKLIKKHTSTLRFLE